jgi:hypothetical protein
MKKYHYGIHYQIGTIIKYHYNTISDDFFIGIIVDIVPLKCGFDNVLANVLEPWVFWIVSPSKSLLGETTPIIAEGMTIL